LAAFLQKEKFMIKKLIVFVGIVVAGLFALVIHSAPSNYTGNPPAPDQYLNTVLGAIWQAGTTTSSNAIYGYGAGSAVSSGSNNIYVVSPGVNNDYGMVRIGNPAVHTNTVLSGTVTTTSNVVAAGYNTSPQTLTFVQATNTASCVISSGGGGGTIQIQPGSSDTAWQEVITNGSSHAWTNTYGFQLQTNFFAIPRTGTNYVVRIDGYQFTGSAINPFTYCPPDTFVASNQTTTSYIVVATGTGTALALSAVLGVQGTVTGP
jgi:hypothetical protein